MANADLGSLAQNAGANPAPAKSMAELSEDLARQMTALVHHEAPKAPDRHWSWKQILPAAALPSAVSGFVKSAMDRAGARSLGRATAAWPA
jgi:hypothetical protein